MEELKERIVYPKFLDEYFKENNVVFKQIPEKYIVLKQDSLPDKTFKNTQTFVKFIQRELDFWSYEGVSNNPMVSSFKSNYEHALVYINDALNYGENSKNNSLSSLRSAISFVINKEHISSKTELAKQLKKFKEKDKYFFYGFESAISSKGTSSYDYPSWHEGFLCGLQYRGTITSIKLNLEEYKTTYADAAKNAEQEFASLVEKSTSLFHEQEEKIKELWELNKLEQEKQQNETNSFIKEKEAKVKALEDTYAKKLELSKPAEYWGKLTKDYKNKGIFWFVISLVISISIIAGIVFLIIKTPQLFQENKYWLDLVKDTALLTVITSIAVYVLRITVKMAISSFHLSRDAKEREMLTGFYLSLNSENNISDKERAIIINSLFSRADTGLLKGDSAPTMLENFSQIYDKDRSH